MSIKSGKKLVFQLKFGLEKCLEIFTVQNKFLVKQMKLKSHSHTQKSAFFTVTKLSADYKKSGKFIRKSLVTIPILKGYMVPEAH